MTGQQTKQGKCFLLKGSTLFAVDFVICDFIDCLLAKTAIIHNKGNVKGIKTLSKPHIIFRTVFAHIAVLQV